MPRLVSAPKNETTRPIPTARAAKVIAPIVRVTRDTDRVREGRIDRAEAIPAISTVSVGWVSVCVDEDVDMKETIARRTTVVLRSEVRSPNRWRGPRRHREIPWKSPPRKSVAVLGKRPPVSVSVGKIRGNRGSIRQFRTRSQGGWLLSQRVDSRLETSSRWEPQGECVVTRLQADTTCCYFVMAETVSASLPSSPATEAKLSDPAWDDAFLRVESYLRAHRLESRELLNRLASSIIREARQRSVSYPDLTPVEISLRVTHARIGRWFSKVWPEGDWSQERHRAQGRLALVMADLPGQWADHFLTEASIPPELAKGMAEFSLQPGPELRFSNMPPAPLEFGFDDATDPERQQRGRWVLARAAISWFMIVGLVSAAAAASLWSLR